MVQVQAVEGVERESPGMTQHIPVIKIVTPEPDKHGVTPVVLQKLTVDGVEWAVVGYELKGNVNGIQHFVMEFLADVTVSHPA